MKHSRKVRRLLTKLSSFQSIWKFGTKPILWNYIWKISSEKLLLFNHRRHFASSVKLKIFKSLKSPPFCFRFANILPLINHNIFLVVVDPSHKNRLCILINVFYAFSLHFQIRRLNVGMEVKSKLMRTTHHSRLTNFFIQLLSFFFFF